MFVCCECCVLSGRALCNELITRPEESYRLWCVVVCDLETSWMRRSRSTVGCRAKNKHLNVMTLSSSEFRENSCSESHILLKSGVIFVLFCVHFSSEFKLN
jgi:hypothetical protein